jgi:hypothetical protein
MSIGKPFVRGMQKVPGSGRVKGSRNKISEAFLHDLATEWEASGPDALKIMAKDEPGNFVKVVAALLPKEFSIEDNRLADLNDEELDLLINELRAKLRTAIVDYVGSGEAQTLN